MSNWGTTPKLSDLLPGGHRSITYCEAISEAMRIALSNDPTVRVFGEGVTDPFGTYATTTNLHKEFGEDRVFDVPVAEELITGMGVGMAIAGLRPIVIHPRNDFLLVAMNQLVNHAAKWRYMFGKKINMPLVIRSVACRGWGSAAQHSQALHSMLAHCPGLNVLVPFTPQDVKGFLLWAVFEAQDPTVVIEHKWLYKLKGFVPEERYSCVPGLPQIVKQGRDVTMVGISYGVADALMAAKKLEDDGIDAEVIDVRSLKPLEIDLICDSVEKTGRIIVIDPGHTLYGAASEIITRLLEALPPSKLASQPIRIGLPDTPIPASSESTYFVTPDNITSIVKRSLKEEYA